MSDKPNPEPKAGPRKAGPGAAYFCPTTGKRLVAPGVSKDVDPVKGVDEYVEPKPVQKVK
jgi:hypothetical protein